MSGHAPPDYPCPFCRFARGEVMPRNAPEDIVYALRQHNEPAGNQDVWHFHLHVFPPWEGDRLYQRHDEAREVEAEERKMYAARLRKALADGGSGFDAQHG